MSDPVFYHPDDYDLNTEEPEGWYFWDETWVNPYGPYETKAEATQACDEYAAGL